MRARPVRGSACFSPPPRFCACSHGSGRSGRPGCTSSGPTPKTRPVERRSMSAFPESHVALLDRPLPAVLTTEMPDGRFQSTVVWFNRDGGHILLNTMREFQKARNLHARPRATLLVVEPEGDERWIEVRGSVLLEDDGALEHLDELTRLYMGAGPYFGRAVPAELALVEDPCGSGSSRPRSPPGRSSSPAADGRSILCPSGGTGFGRARASHRSPTTIAICWSVRSLRPAARACRAARRRRSRSGANPMATTFWSTRPANAGAVATWRPIPARPCWSSTPRAASDGSRSAPTWTSSVTARRSRTTASSVHRARSVLRTRLPGRAASVRDTGDRSAPSPPDHLRRDPRMRRLAAAGQPPVPRGTCRRRRTSSSGPWTWFPEIPGGPPSS